MSVAVIIATFGDKARWDRMSMRAILSVEEQSLRPQKIMRIHGATLQEARNSAAIEAKTEWLCFLDADDELESEYVEAMVNADGDIRYPNVKYVRDGKPDSQAVNLAAHDIYDGNYMVVSSFVRRKMFLEVGGFSDLPVYEDWDLWLRCIQAGAHPRSVPGAVIRVHDNAGSRNKNPESLRYWHEIRECYLGNNRLNDV